MEQWSNRAAERACQIIQILLLVRQSRLGGPALTRCAADREHLGRPEYPKQAALEATNILHFFGRE